MSNEVLNIKTTMSRFFIQYLTLKKPIIEARISVLTGEKNIQIPAKMLHVLAMLLYYNNQYSDNGEEERWEKVFNRRHRDIYCESLDMKDSQLNTYFSMLRKYKILTGNRVNKAFLITPGDEEYELTFKFSINGDEE